MPLCVIYQHNIIVPTDLDSTVIIDGHLTTMKNTAKPWKNRKNDDIIK
jgi:hypothetical protein